MDILKETKLISSHTERLDDFNGDFITAQCGNTGETNIGTMDRNKEWFLTVSLCVKFWANKAQFSDSVKLAEKVLLNRIYGDILGQLYELRLEISNGNKMASIEMCNKIEATIFGNKGD